MGRAAALQTPVVPCAAVYARISSDPNDTSLGVTRQVKDCLALAERKGWTVGEVFTDNDVSATSGRPRPEYERMMAALAAGRFGALVVWDVGRLTHALGPPPRVPAPYLLRQLTDCWAVRPGVADEACLVASELVTNALTHGRSDAVLRILHRDGLLRVEVLDDDTRLPVIVAPDPYSLSGRGLTLVASLATLWGAERTAYGKAVWAEFDLSDRRAP